ncbi:hypothetical protein GOP47_0016611 [Adiantum capillus-veneris]|uniref:Cystinosin homolog n=1 Tax=Adiantum capillus-veneris TaxID=13818 RepID=A0A9D4UJ06_ADICA|nr:hypothetical protein GOP47_0016611 [Adiantum capillus-veneris]
MGELSAGAVGAEWNSLYLQLLYQALGWFAFAAWSCSFYPQIVLNFTRKSVVGLNFDYILLNSTKHSCYLIYNASMYFSPVIQYQYHVKYGFSELIPVAPSDVAFSIHAVLMTWLLAYQIIIYERGSQGVSKAAIAISGGAWIVAAICLGLAWPQGRWLWLISNFNLIQVVLALIKYMPQVWLNYERKSTFGWSIGNVLFDMSGGVGNFFQMAVQSIDQGSLDNFSGNLGKILLSSIVIVFDLLFTVQHYILYHDSKGSGPSYVALDLEDEKAEANKLPV